MMEPSKALKFCNRWLQAWTGNRPDELIKFYSFNAFYADPANPKGLTGHERIFPYFKKLLAANPAWRWRCRELFPTEKGFIVKWQAAIPVRETEIIEYGLDIVEMSHDRITRNEVYFDRTKLLSALKNTS